MESSQVAAATVYAISQDSYLDHFLVVLLN